MHIFCLSQNFTNNIILGHVHIREISCSHFQRQPLKGSSKKKRCSITRCISYTGHYQVAIRFKCAYPFIRSLKSFSSRVVANVRKRWLLSSLLLKMKRQCLQNVLKLGNTFLGRAPLQTNYPICPIKPRPRLNDADAPHPP